MNPESQFYKKVSRILDSNQSTVLLDRNGKQIDSEGLTQLVTSFSEKVPVRFPLL